MSLKNIDKTASSILLAISCLAFSACSHLTLSDKEMAELQKQCQNKQQDVCLHGDPQARKVFYDETDDFIRDVERTNLRNKK